MPKRSKKQDKLGVRAHTKKGCKHLFIPNISEETKRRFKSACSVAGHSMTHVITSFMVKYSDLQLIPGKGEQEGEEP